MKWKKPLYLFLVTMHLSHHGPVNMADICIKIIAAATFLRVAHHPTQSSRYLPCWTLRDRNKIVRSEEIYCTRIYSRPSSNITVPLFQIRKVKFLDDLVEFWINFPKPLLHLERNAFSLCQIFFTFGMTRSPKYFAALFHALQYSTLGL